MAWAVSRTTLNQSSVATAVTRNARVKTATKDTQIATNHIALISATSAALEDLASAVDRPSLTQ